jgi:hypothetical protein
MVTSHDLHVDLARFYRGFRGVSAPENVWTEELWEQIELAELLESVVA